MLRRTGTIVGVAAALALVTAPGAAAKLRSFGGKFTETSQTTADQKCDGFRNTLSGTGTTTLGKAKARGHACITFESNGGVHIHDGQIVMTISRGNTINVEYEAFGGPPDAAGMFHLKGYFFLNDGTGKYKNTFGAGRLAATAGLIADTTIDLKGRILLPKQKTS